MGEDGRKRDGEGSVAGPVTQFALSGLVVVLLLGIVGVLAIRQVAETEATRNARRLTRVAGEGIVEPELTAAVVAGEPGALERLDRVVRERLLHPPVVRVKIWARDGRIVYSDEPRLIGDRYPLGEDDEAAFDASEVVAEVSDLDEPENRFEPTDEPLLEVYFPLQAADGTPLLFETYQNFEQVVSSAERIFFVVAPVLLAALVLLELVQVPLALSLGRRLRQGAREREDLTRKALDASEAERRRIARDLHDGVVQDLAGLGFSLSAAADRAASLVPEDVAGALREGANEARRTIRQLRSLIVEIHPPNLHTEGLAAALGDLVAQLDHRDIEAKVSTQGHLNLERDAEACLYRAAREGVRNAVAHADPSRIDICVAPEGDNVVLTVTDDGKGFSPDEALSKRKEGHLGLALLHELAKDCKGSVDLDSSPGRGTRLTVKVPA